MFYGSATGFFFGSRFWLYLLNQILQMKAKPPKDNDSKSTFWIILLRETVFVLVTPEHSFTGSIPT